MVVPPGNTVGVPILAEIKVSLRGFGFYDTRLGQQFQAAEPFRANRDDVSIFVHVGLLLD